MTIEDDHMIAGYIGIPDFENEPNSLKFAKKLSTAPSEDLRNHFTDMMGRYNDIEDAIRKMNLTDALIHPKDYVRKYRSWYEKNKKEDS